MYLEDFVGCCAVATVVDLPFILNKTQMKCQRDALKSLLQEARQEGFSIVVATTIQAQESGALLLKEAGFKPSLPARRDPKHSSNKNLVTLWVKRIMRGVK